MNGRRNAGNAGFSLLEVLVALAILTIGISTAIALFAAATAAHKRAIARTQIAAIAEEAFADIESALQHGASPDDLQKNPPFDDVKAEWPDYAIDAHFRMIDGPTEQDELYAEVRIHWIFRGRARVETFGQIIARQLVR